jgi:hypothetical protein
MNAEEIAQGFGVHSATVRGWIRRGLLEARWFGKIHQVTRRQVRAFVHGNPNAFELWRTDQTWFLDIVLGGPGHEKDRDA